MTDVSESKDSGVADTTAAGYSPYNARLNVWFARKLGCERCCRRAGLARALYWANSSAGKLGWRRTSIASANHCSKVSDNPEAERVVEPEPNPEDAESDAPRVSICSAICLLVRVFVPSSNIRAAAPASPGWF